MTKQLLIDFEEDIGREFNSSNIKSPIHLYNGNEDQMINIFKDIKKDDWVMCSWRSHYQCLLKGVPINILKDRILNNKSISLCFPEYRIYSSAIVGGILPISVGVGLSLKMLNKSEKVYCFVGDMTAETGCFHESLKYVKNHNLPVKFIIEDNGKSVCTDTFKTWGMSKSTYEDINDEHVFYYKYVNKCPHSGAGKWVMF